jgi:molecular chaperone GrpE
VAEQEVQQEEAAVEAASDAAPAEEQQAAERVEEDLDELRTRAAERDEYLALAQRTQADFENYRRRMARESAQAADRGVTKVAKELLPALDHLELALRAASADAEPAGSAGPDGDVVKGFAMVRDELAAALGRVGIEAFSPQGEPFDPNEHEAMAQVPAEDAQAGTVVQVYQQGYRFNGAVLRPARVVVAQ